LKFRKFSSDLIFWKNDDIFFEGLVRENWKKYGDQAISADTDRKIPKIEISSKNDDI